MGGPQGPPNNIILPYFIPVCQRSSSIHERILYYIQRKFQYFVEVSILKSFHFVIRYRQKEEAKATS